MERITLLTSAGRHAFYFRVEGREDIVTRPGFTSGYPGEGPAGLAIVLTMLKWHGFLVEEVLVPEQMMRRIETAALSSSDKDFLDTVPPVRPWRISEYVHQALVDRGGTSAEVGSHYPLVPPFGLVDQRIWEFALLLPSDPDGAISKAYRRLEQTIVTRCALTSFGRNAMREAFFGAQSRLMWEGVPQKEADGRAELFMAAFTAGRNPRAHRQVADSPRDALREFLLINELFLMDAEAVIRP